MPHTDCQMASGEEVDVHRLIAERFGVDTRSIEIRTVDDQVGALITDVVRVRAYPLLPTDLVVGGRDLRRAHRTPAADGHLTGAAQPRGRSTDTGSPPIPHSSASTS